MNTPAPYAQARQNMLECQILPNGVVNRAFLAQFGATPREKFVMHGQEGIAHGDEDLALGIGRWLMEPTVQAKILNAAEPKENDHVLDVGSATGYMAAILSPLVKSVVSVEGQQPFPAMAQKNWADLGLKNITSVAGNIAAGAPDTGPYSLIIVNGAVAIIPPVLLDQLSVGGRMVVVVNDKPHCTVGQARVIVRTSEDHFSDRPLFDAAVPCLPEFMPRKEFVF